MTSNPINPSRVLDRLRLLLDILESAPTHGTHKYVLVLAVLDGILGLQSDPHSQARLSSLELADRVVDIYWDQTHPYVTVSGRTVSLNQVNRSAKGPHVYLASVASLQERFPALSAHVIRQRHSAEYLVAQRTIGAALANNPIPRFHVGFTSAEPLWEIEGTGAGTSLNFDASTLAMFALFASTIREVAERRFVDKILALNDLADDRSGIEAHVFGAERIMPPASMRSALASLQGGQCLYTGQKLTRPSIDHFLPWRLIHLSEIQNLVVTNGPVNSAKGSRLAGGGMLDRWRSHIRENEQSLDRIAEEFSWPSNSGLVLAAAHHLYSERANGVLWRSEQQAGVSRPDTFRPSRPAVREEASRNEGSL